LLLELGGGETFYVYNCASVIKANAFSHSMGLGVGVTVPP
jgi:hypothetical protein